MSQANWNQLTGGLGATDVAHGATQLVAPTSGAGDWSYGFNSLTAVAGVVGWHVNLSNFDPMLKGGSIRGVFQRGVSPGPTGFSPMLFIGLQGSAVGSQGYILGLSDAASFRIVLRKGALSGGIPDVAPGTSGVLKRSANVFPQATWLHLRLDMIVNLTGDVILQMYRNDLALHPIGSTPDWQIISGTAAPPAFNGTAAFLDDSLGVNSGSLPFVNGRAGFAFQTAVATRRAFFDELELERQL
ncbi:MAG: hypothetical protein A2Y38_16445 [Spirochaetes bacterium GWB1_59_5]|nr:MAG: hypothetical protein A2Y38_16445 [Spirochaetes bacterium GWB1_59_5]